FPRGRCRRLRTRNGRRRSASPRPAAAGCHPPLAASSAQLVQVHPPQRTSEDIEMTRNPLVRAAVTLASPARKIPVAARTVTSGGARAPRAAAGSFPVGRCDTSFPDPGPGTGRDRPGSAFAAIARGRFASGLGGAAAVAAALWLAPAAAFAAGTFYVDGANPSASDSNPGTETRPYLTITAAVDAKGGPGTTNLVKPPIYREQGTISRSGA